MGGVINIITKKQSGKAAGKLKGGYSEGGASSESLSYFLPIGGRSLTISAAGSTSNGFNMSSNYTPVAGSAEDGGRRLNSDFNKSDYGFKFGHEGTNPTYINFNYTKNDMGMPITVNPSTSGDNPLIAVGTLSNKVSSYERFTNWQSWTADLDREQNFTDNFKLRAKAYYHKFDNTLAQYNKTFSAEQTQGTTFQTPFESAYNDYEAGLRLLSNWDITKNDQLNFSLNAIEDKHKKQPSPGLPWDEFVTRTYSIGAEDNVKLSERLALVSGVSYDTFNPKSNVYYSYPNSPADVVPSAPKHKTGGGIKSAYNPMFGINITPDANNAFHITIGKKTRFPTQGELYSSKNGNPDLKPQKSNEFETGYEYKYGSGYSVSFTYFSNSVHGLINPDPHTNIETNISHASLNGYEMGLKKTSGKLTGSVMRTYTRARDDDKHIPLTYIPSRKLDLDLGYNFYKSMVFDLFGTYASPRYYTPTNTTIGELPEYTVLNAGLSGDLKCISTKWHVYVDNITDRNYMEEDGYPQEGRTLRGEVEYDF
jgi:outer membrane cobalamin receptor